MEIVTGPDIRSGKEAAAFTQQLMLILQRLETCDANMAEGSLRVDANVSVRPKGSSTFGHRLRGEATHRNAKAGRGCIP